MKNYNSYEDIYDDYENGNIEYSEDLYDAYEEMGIIEAYKLDREMTTSVSILSEEEEYNFAEADYQRSLDDWGEE